MDKNIKKALKNKYKKSAGARTNIHNKRIEAVQTVRKAKKRELDYEKVIYHNQAKLKKMAKTEDALKENIKKERNLARGRIDKNSPAYKKAFFNETQHQYKRSGLDHKGKSIKEVDPKSPSRFINKESIDRAANFDLENDFAEKDKTYLKAKSDHEKYNIDHKRYRNKSYSIHNKNPEKGGMFAKVTVLKDKVVKSDKKAMLKEYSYKEHKGIKDRHKMAVRLSKKSLAPESFLVEGTKRKYPDDMDLGERAYKVQDKGIMPELSDSDKKGYRTQQRQSERKALGRHLIAKDTHEANLAKTKKGKVQFIDTGAFEDIKPTSLSRPRDMAKEAKRLEKFTIKKSNDPFRKMLAKNAKKGLKRLPMVAGAVGLASALMEPKAEARERALDDALDPVPFGADRVEAPTLTKKQVTEYMKRKYATDPDYRKQRKLRGN